MIKFEVVDLFAGAGGTTTGVERAEIDGQNIARVIAAVNHDANAIASHTANHSSVMHFTEDITTLDVTKLPKFSTDPEIISCLWASLECTNFSLAKGGQSRDADSRTLAEHLDRYVAYLNPDYIQIENVKEFMTWGPLIQKTSKLTGELMFDRKNNPIMIPDPKFKGDDYRRWVEYIKSFGYEFEYRLINSADYGAYTSRIRYFGMFAKIGMPMVFPTPTHEKYGRNGLPPWKAVKHMLDLWDEGESIFTRALRGKKPLCEKTMNRLAYGINKFVLADQGEFLMAYYGTGNNVSSVDSPCPTMTTKDRFAKISVKKKQGAINSQFLLEFYGRDNAVQSLDESCHTITTGNRKAMVTVDAPVQFISPYYGGAEHATDINAPINTITTKDHNALVTTEIDKDKIQFLTNQIQNKESTNSSIEAPIGTLLTKESRYLVTVDAPAQFLTTHMHNRESASQSLEDPASPVLTKDSKSLVSVDINKSHFIHQQFSGADNVSSIEDPLGAIMGNPKASIVSVEVDQFISKQYTQGSQASSIEEPLGTITTVPKHHLITVLHEAGVIKDIRMRMVKVKESKKIMDIGENYVLMGNQTVQKKAIGNMVVPIVPEVWYMALHNAITIQLTPAIAA